MRAENISYKALWSPKLFYDVCKRVAFFSWNALEIKVKKREKGHGKRFLLGKFQTGICNI